MALGAALVDRARRVYRVGQPVLLPAPLGLVATAWDTDGDLAAHSYRYVVTALREGKETAVSAEALVTVASAEGRASLTWTAVVGATGYRVYRKQDAGAFLRVAEVTSPAWKDVGSATPAGSPPVSGTARGRAGGALAYTTNNDPWFRCRLELPGPNASADTTGRRRVIIVPTLMYGPRDSSGQPIVLTEEDRVEVESKQLGSALWQCDGRPTPMRRRRTVLGWELQLKRVESKDAETV